MRGGSNVAAKTHKSRRRKGGVVDKASARSGNAKASFWLAELDVHGKPTLREGPHSERADAHKGLYLMRGLRLAAADKLWAIAEVILTPPDDSKHAVNDRAVRRCREVLRRARKKEAK